MSTGFKRPDDLAEEVVRLRLPQKTDARLQTLMEQNNEGRLSAAELQELESLVEMSETISLLRAKALKFLGRKP
jgi:hypothetical protein